MTKIMGMPISQVIDYKNSILTEPFAFFSDILKQWCVVPRGFSCDWESVPLFKGTSKVGGLVHDYLCRKDSNPVVTKKVAADVYLEIMKFRGNSYIRRYTKYWTVRMAWGYFHKKKVL